MCGKADTDNEEPGKFSNPAPVCGYVAYIGYIGLYWIYWMYWILSFVNLLEVMKHILDILDIHVLDKWCCGPAC